MKNTWVVVLLVVLVAILLGLVAYLWLFKGKATSQTQAEPTATQVAGSGEATPKARILSNLLLYPGSTQGEPTYGTGSGAKVFIPMKTIDEVTTISNYYEKLAAFNGWELGSSGIATDMSGAWLNIEQDDFTASIQMSRASKTTSIELSIHYTSELINSKTQALPLSEHPTPAPTSDSSGAISTETEGDYIFSESDKKLLEKSELLSLGDWQLKVARNEIYARHGREFVHKDLQCYFATKGWYKVDSSYSTGDLSNLENKNVALILNYEKEKGSSLLATDSGCKN